MQTSPRIDLLFVKLYYPVCVENFTAMSRQVSHPGRGNLGPDEGNHRILWFEWLQAHRCAAVGAACIASMLSHFIVLPSFPFLDMQPFENIASFPIVTSCGQFTERKTEHVYFRGDKWFNVSLRRIYIYVCICVCACVCAMSACFVYFWVLYTPCPTWGLWNIFSWTWLTLKEVNPCWYRLAAAESPWDCVTLDSF